MSAIFLKNDNELVHNGKSEFSNLGIWKTKIEYYEDKVNTDFYENKMPIEIAHCVWLSIVLIDSVFKIDIHFYAKLFF